MNCEVIELPAVEACGSHQFREVLRCLLHTIIFNRALGYVKPKDVDLEMFDITYVQCDDAELEAKVESKISEFCCLMEKKPSMVAQLRLAFYENRKKAAWFGSKDERLYWEQWFINIAIPSGHAHQRALSGHGDFNQSQPSGGLELAQAEIIRFVNEKRDHIPPVAANSPTIFPFDISMAGGSNSAFESKVKAMKNILMQTAPPAMLS